jgi:hypothetical protein
MKLLIRDLLRSLRHLFDAAGRRENLRDECEAGGGYDVF